MVPFLRPARKFRTNEIAEVKGVLLRWLNQFLFLEAQPTILSKIGFSSFQPWWETNCLLLAWSGYRKALDEAARKGIACQWRPLNGPGSPSLRLFANGWETSKPRAKDGAPSKPILGPDTVFQRPNLPEWIVPRPSRG